MTGTSQQDDVEPKARPTEDLSEFIKVLRETHTVETVPVRWPLPATGAERPATARIREQEARGPAGDRTPEPPEEQGGGGKLL